MTLQEFKAWFEGYTENIQGVPTLKQWKRIKARVEEVDEEPITRRVFVDRFYLPRRNYWDYEARWLSSRKESSAADEQFRAKITSLMRQAGSAEFRAS